MESPFLKYFLFLLFACALLWSLEIFIPWRKEQRIFRRDFWLDGFYLMFNLLVLPVAGFFFFTILFAEIWQSLIRTGDLENPIAFYFASLPVGARLAAAFVFRDFLHWNLHYFVLHRMPIFWEFHKVHHSAKELGFAANVRFHWMEHVLYRAVDSLVFLIGGLNTEEFLVINAVTLLIGLYNHSNINLPLGPFRYVLNNPQMHIWHHARDVPSKYGFNFGFALAVWDYLFNTAWIPQSGRDETLGFPGMEGFPLTLKAQLLYPFFRVK